MRSTKTLPSNEQILGVLTACEGAITNISAPLLLAMPTQVCVGSDVSEDNLVWTPREVAPIFETNVEAAVDAALSLAARTRRPTDDCLLIPHDPRSWIKVSTRLLKIPFGLSLLAGLVFGFIQRL